MKRYLPLILLAAGAVALYLLHGHFIRQAPINLRPGVIPAGEPFPES